MRLVFNETDLTLLLAAIVVLQRTLADETRELPSELMMSSRTAFRGEIEYLRRRFSTALKACRQS